MKKRNIIKLLTASLGTFIALGSLSSCSFSLDKSDKEDNTIVENEIYTIYEQYLNNGGTLSYEDWLKSIKGEKGDPGKDGVSIIKVEKTKTEGLVDTYTITFSNGETFSYTVTNGSQGSSTTSDNIVASGKCGDSVNWKLTKDGTLTIYGTGNMWEYYKGRARFSTPVLLPWSSYSSAVTSVVFEEGVTSICRFACVELTNVERISIPSTVTKIGSGAFAHLYKIESIYIPATVTEIEQYAVSGFDDEKDILGPYYRKNPIVINCEAASKPANWDNDWVYIDSSGKGAANPTVNWGVPRNQ